MATEIRTRTGVWTGWGLRLAVCLCAVGLSAPLHAEEPAQGSDASAGGAAGDSGGAGAYSLKLRQIEERVNELKEKIFQSKARLIQLQEVVLHGAISGAKGVVVHRNQMGSSFRLTRIQYSLDGSQIFSRVAEEGSVLDEEAEIEVFNGAIAPGSHQLSIYLEYGGAGFGLFTYLEGYSFKVKSSYVFTAEEGKVTTVKVTGYEKGGFTTPLEDRPSVKFDVDATRALRDEVAPPSAGGAETSPPAGEAGGQS